MSDDAALALLADGELEIVGRLPYSSNATFLTQICLGGESTLAVYKPARGERPLWDFPSGLFERERAAYLLADALGWWLVPPTVVRDGPLGTGSVQWFVEADPDAHYFTLLEDESLHDQLRRVCVFDLLANSTDRKGGHLLVDVDGHVWAIDNGLTFHAEFKLRTVIWDFAHEPMPDDELADVARFVEQGVPDDLAALLDPFESDALLARARAVLDTRRFPHDPTGRRWPWPVV
jgi:uncharacterized repeat protein (TIGR03843 family)